MPEGAKRGNHSAANLPKSERAAREPAVHRFTTKELKFGRRAIVHGEVIPEERMPAALVWARRYDQKVKSARP
jgi:hypothetical protein